jgi:spore coat protein CotF
MDNEFVKEAHKLFQKNFPENITPILKALLTHRFDVVVSKQKEVLQKMRKKGVVNTERLVLEREDFPSFLLK